MILYKKNPQECVFLIFFLCRRHWMEKVLLTSIFLTGEQRAEQLFIGQNTQPELDTLISPEKRDHYSASPHASKINK